MRRILTELKRRNVLRAAAGYAVVAWLVIQIVDTVFPILGIPDWATRMVVILAIIGFPVTIVISWIYEWTPAGVMTAAEADDAGYAETVSRGRLVDFVIIGLLAIAVGWLLYERTRPIQTLENSIAVIPFVNLSSEPEQEFFSDGMAEEILNLLATVPELKVIGRTSSSAFRSGDIDVGEIGRSLGVQNVLRGSVRKAGERVRITAQLISAADGTQLWSSNYDRDLVDVFAVQDSVAAEIIRALQIRIGAEPARGRPTENTDAYVRFLEARALMNEFETVAAIEKLKQATELDPGFAEAYELLSYNYSISGGYYIPNAEAQRLTYQAATDALAINPNLVFASGLLLLSETSDVSFSSLIDAYEETVRAEPSNMYALSSLGNLLFSTGYLNEAADIARRYIELDPYAAPAHYDLVNALYAVGRPGEAAAARHIAQELGILGFTDWIDGETYLAESKDDPAIESFETDIARSGVPGGWIRELIINARDPVNGEAYLGSGIAEALRLIPDNAKYQWQVRLSLFYLLMGYVDQYFDFINPSAIESNEWSSANIMIWAGTMYRNLGFTAHTRYLELAERIGYFELWDDRGPPDFCDKRSGRWACH